MRGELRATLHKLGMGDAAKELLGDKQAKDLPPVARVAQGGTPPCASGGGKKPYLPRAERPWFRGGKGPGKPGCGNKGGHR
jgi:hypothetical protein